MNQKIVYTGKPSKVLIGIEFFKMFVIMTLIYLTLMLIQTKLNIHENDIVKNLTKFSFIFLSIFAAVRVMIVTLRVTSVCYTLMTETFQTKKGLLNIRKDSIELYRVKDISTYQPFIYRFFGIANITLYTSDVSTPVITMMGIKDFDELSEKLRDQIEVARTTSIIETI